MPRSRGSRGPSPRWLCNETIDAGTRRWAVEGLAYLTFDADVKEEFVEDKAAMQAMFHLAKVRAERWGRGAGWWAPWLRGNVPEGVVGLMLWRWGVWRGPVVLGGLESRPLLSIMGVMGAPLSLQSEDRSVLYAVASTLVNCTNSYDHEEPDPQMLELAKYAKQHIPEQHPKVSGAQLFSGPAGSPGHGGERLGGTEPGVPSGDRVSLGPSGVRWETGATKPSGDPASGTGQAGLREAPGAEAADGWCGVSSGLHGEEREPGAHQLLPGADLQVRACRGVAGRDLGSEAATVLLVNLRACGECKLLGEGRGCLGVWCSLGPLQVSECSSCSHFVPRVFLALVEEAEDRGGVVAQGGGKVRGQAPLCLRLCHVVGLWGGLGLCGGWLRFGRGLHRLQRTRGLGKLALL